MHFAACFGENVRVIVCQPKVSFVSFSSSGECKLKLSLLLSVSRTVKYCVKLRRGTRQKFLVQHFIKRCSSV